MNKIYISILALFLCNSAISQINLDSLLIGYWSFNGNLTDESTNLNDAFSYNCNLTSDHLNTEDKAFEFNGIDSYMEVPSSFNQITLPFSISAWVYKTEIKDYEHIFSSSSQSGEYHGIYLGVNPEGKVQISYSDGGPEGSGSRRSKATDSSILINEWVHITAVVNGPNDMLIQFNCMPMTGSYSGSGGELFNGEKNAMIGRATHNLNFWSGKIDELRLYNRALTSEEIMAICDPEPPFNIHAPIKQKEFHLYPNPAQEFIKLNGIDDFSSCMIYNNQGKLIRNFQLNTKDKLVNVSDLKTGIYYLTLIGSKGNFSKIFIIE